LRKAANKRLQWAIDQTVQKNSTSHVVRRSLSKAVDEALDKKPVKKAMKKEAERSHY
jgi:hypothetical protein